MQPENPYNFIMEPSKQKQPAGHIGTKNKIVVMIALGLVMITVLSVGFVLLTSIGKANNDDLVSLRAQQTEILRLIDISKKDLIDASLKNKLTSMQVFITSDGEQLNDLLIQREVEVTKEQLAKSKDSEVDSTLEKAKQEGALDKAVLDVVSDQSNEYYDTLVSALAEATTTKEKDLLKTLISNIEASAKN